MVDSERGGVLSYANIHLAVDLCTLVADLRVAKEPFSLAPYSVAPLFLHQELVGGSFRRAMGQSSCTPVLCAPAAERSADPVGRL